MTIQEYNWSTYQKNIFADIADVKNTHNLMIEALAGAAKTTTLVKAVSYIPAGKSILMVAFNKRIAEDLKKKIGFKAEVKTLHALGLKSIFSKFPKISVDQNKLDRILDTYIGSGREYVFLKKSLKKTVSLCKAYLISGNEMIDFVIDEHDIDPSIDRDVFINHVQKILSLCANQTSSVDFDDMIWFCHIHNIKPNKYHYTIIDECQDLDPAQVQLALKTKKRNGRIIAAGDSNQVLYSFKAVSLDSVKILKSLLEAKSLPLSITYRCPVLVTKEAQQYVSHIEYAPTAIEGIVDRISPEKMKNTAKPGCFILSRTNAPLIEYALHFIKNEIPAIILGKDIGDNLLVLIKKSKKKNLDEFLSWLDSWEDKEIKRLVDKDMNFDHIVDKADCLRAIGESCETLSELKNKILNLFEDTNEENVITLSSTHRAKGSERDIVYLLWNTYRSNNREEKNIKYVAVSRAKRELYYVI